jgi:hypothetical protein
MDIRTDWGRLEIVVHNLTAVLQSDGHLVNLTFDRRPCMADPSGRAELLAEVEELQRQQLEANVSATYVGWTEAEVAAHDKRVQRMALLRAQVAALDSHK